MSGLFGGGGDGGASKQLEMQREQIEKGERREMSERTELAKRSLAAIKARQGGGLRMLMTGTDDQSKTKLGGGG